jgi:hypothetical protein
VGVEQHDRDRVDVHQRDDPIEQLIEQVGAVEAGQRGVGDGFDASQPIEVVQLVTHPVEPRPALLPCDNTRTV